MLSCLCPSLCLELMEHSLGLRGKALVTTVNTMNRDEYSFLDQFLSADGVNGNLFRHHNHSSRVNNSSNFTASKDERLYLICLRSIRVWLDIHAAQFLCSSRAIQQPRVRVYESWALN